VGGEQLRRFHLPKAGFPFPKTKKNDRAKAKQKSEANRKEGEMGMNTII
jgi:hypothetical protein